jgi:hypothetical protein
MAKLATVVNRWLWGNARVGQCGGAGRGDEPVVVLGRCRRVLKNGDYKAGSAEEPVVVVGRCRRALEEGKTAELATLINHNFDLRRSIFGDEVLGAQNLHMISVARSVGGMALPIVPAICPTSLTRKGKCEGQMAFALPFCKVCNLQNICVNAIWEAIYKNIVHLQCPC